MLQRSRLLAGQFLKTRQKMSIPTCRISTPWGGHFGLPSAPVSVWWGSPENGALFADFPPPHPPSSRWDSAPTSCQRPYHVEHTSSRLITEVKQRWARLVLGWVTAWEHRVLLVFFFYFLPPFFFWRNFWCADLILSVHWLRWLLAMCEIMLML